MSLRRRSGAKADDMPDAKTTTSPRSGTPKKPLLAAALLSFLILAGVLIARLQWSPISNLTPSINAEDDVPVTSGNSAYRLHPERHIHRPPAATRQRWHITSGLRRPDGVLKRVYLINDAFPGPTLEARPGDSLVIDVENALEDEGVSMHWHGLSMRGANDMDGAVGITQLAIAPGETFTYNFTIEDGQHGTFWYHAHDGVQRAEGLFGGLIVHEPASVQDLSATEEHLLMVGDWYHRSAQDALEFYMHPGSFGNEAVPDSLLLNGAGVFQCGDAVPARPLDCEQLRVYNLPALQLNGSKMNLLRVVNVGSYAGINLSISGALVKPIRIDGGTPITGQTAKRVETLQPGERLDMTVESAPRAHPKDTQLQVSLDTTPFKYPNPALTPVQSSAVEWTGPSLKRSKAAKPVVEKFSLSDSKHAHDQSSILPANADMTIVLYAVTQRLAHLSNVPRGFINNTSWDPQLAPLISTSRSEWNKKQFVPFIQLNAERPLWVDVVLNNLDEEAHPFHLHGYDFWVLSKYSSTYNWGKRRWNSGRECKY